MRIEVRPVGRLRGPDQAATTDAIARVLAAAGNSSADLATLRVVVDWIQYKESFREPADLRPILSRVPPRRPEPGRAGPGRGRRMDAAPGRRRRPWSWPSTCAGRAARSATR